MLEVLIFLKGQFPQFFQSFFLTQVFEVQIFVLLNEGVVVKYGLKHVCVSHFFVEVQRQPQLAYFVF